MNKRKVIIPALMLCVLAACKKSNTTVPIDKTIDCAKITYSKTIKPLFDANCLSCHGPTSGDGPLSTYAEIKHYVDNGKLKDEVLTTRGMPIGTKFTSIELGQVQCWLDAGAPNN